jgi:hypothetical protein
MRNQHLKFSTLFLVLSILLAIGGGVFFGLFSCGGYRWHSQAFIAVFSFSLLALITFQPAMPKDRAIRVILGAGAVALFFVVRAGASAFYPDAPGSWGEFFERFYLGLLYGPC